MEAPDAKSFDQLKMDVVMTYLAFLNCLSAAFYWTLIFIILTLIDYFYAIQ
jgi:hypothetical protein